MRDWSIYQADTVRSAKDSDKNRLILEFSKDFKEKMGYDLDISCPKCFRNDFNKFLNKTIMPENKKCSFKLKPMYDGLSLGFGSKIFISSANINDAIATKFANEHPKGLGLFSEYPKDFGKKKTVKKSANKKNA